MKPLQASFGCIATISQFLAGFLVIFSKHNPMRKNKILFCMTAVTGLLFASCNSDDGGFERTIVGKWNYNKTIVTTGNGTPTDQSYVGHENGCEKDHVEFKEGGIFRNVLMNKDQNNACVEDASQSTWAKNGNTLTIGTDTYQVTKLNGSELRYENTVDVSGVPVKVVKVFTKN